MHHKAKIELIRYALLNEHERRGIEGIKIGFDTYRLLDNKYMRKNEHDRFWGRKANIPV